jgi:hypothetical protein
MRRQAVWALGTIGVVVWLTGCAKTPSPTPSPKPTAAPASAVNIQITGADTAHLVSAVAVPCSPATGNGSQRLLGVGLGAAHDPVRGEIELNLTIVGFKSTGTYNAAAVWAADGATSVTLDPDPTGQISAERFVAQSGTVTVTAVQGDESGGTTSPDFTGAIDAVLVPESPTTPAQQVTVSGTWSCTD